MRPYGRGSKCGRLDFSPEQRAALTGRLREIKETFRYELLSAGISAASSGVLLLVGSSGYEFIQSYGDALLQSPDPYHKILGGFGKAINFGIIGLGAVSAALSGYTGAEAVSNVIKGLTTTSETIQPPMPAPLEPPKVL